MDKLFEENRTPTNDEKKILAKYVGWGGLQQAFDEHNESWQKEYQQLKNLLSDGDYDRAKGSTLNAHYTSREVIEGIYKALDRFGVKGNNRILEPAMGTGNFFGYMPQTIAENAKLYGVELDNITGRIAQKLYPNVSVQIKGFEETSFPNNHFDIFISNVPFGNYSVYDTEYNKHNFNIHDYFIAKGIDKLKPNGIMAVVTSKGTMDKLTPTVRKHIADRAQLVGAIRLPNTAFKQTANTEVTADILFFQKRDEVINSSDDWIKTSGYIIEKNDETNQEVKINSYFADNPKMMLGTLVQEHKLYGAIDVTLNPDGRELTEALSDAISLLPKDIYKNPEPSLESEQEEIEVDYDLKPLCFKASGGKIYMRVGGLMEEQPLPSSPQNAYERIAAMIELRSDIRHILDIQSKGCSDETLAIEQQRLNTKYDRFVRNYGIINGQTNTKLFREDGDSALLFSLENIDEETKAVTKADIFSKRTIRPYTVVTHTDDCFEALQISKNEKGKVDIAYIEELTNKDYDTILSELDTAIFRNPLGVIEGDKYSGFQTSEEYLSGEVVKKLKIASQFVVHEKKPEFERNVKALTEVQPEPIKASDISARLGASWINKEYYAYLSCRAIIAKLDEQPSDVEPILVVGYREYTSILVQQIVKLLLEYYRGDSNAVLGGYIDFSVDDMETLVMHKSQGSRVLFKPDKTVIITPIGITFDSFKRITRTISDIIGKESGETDELTLWDESAIAQRQCLFVTNYGQSDFFDNCKRDKQGNHVYTVENNSYYFLGQVANDIVNLHQNECGNCFPNEPIEEKLLVSVNSATSKPDRIFGLLPSPAVTQTNSTGTPLSFAKFCGYLQGCMRYAHIVRNENHHQFYIDTKQLFSNIQNDDLEYKVKKMREKLSANHINDNYSYVFNILVSPEHKSNSAFIKFIAESVFNHNIKFVHFPIENTYREDVRAQLAYISNDIRYINETFTNALLNIYYVDDTIISGKSINLMRQRVEMLIREALRGTDLRLHIRLFDGIFVLLNRLSPDTMKSILSTDGTTNNISDVRRSDEKLPFYSFFNLPVPSYKTKHFNCPACVLSNMFEINEKRSATNEIAKIWRTKKDRNQLLTIDDYDIKMKEKHTELSLIGIQRLFSLHQAYNYIAINLLPLKNNIEDYYKQTQIMIMEFLVNFKGGRNDDVADKIEWFISNVKAFSRPFLALYHHIGQSILTIALEILESLLLSKTIVSKHLADNIKYVENINQILILYNKRRKNYKE